MKLRFTRILMLSATAAVAAACTCQGPRQTQAESQPEEETAAEEIVGEPTTLKKYSVILMTAMTDEGGNLEGLSKALNGFSIRE